jgi:pimeloyl-ACP methyl ester carboxylesterase
MFLKNALGLFVGAIALASALLVPAGAQEGKAFVFSEAPGPLPVGLKVVQQYDLSRSSDLSSASIAPALDKGQARPLQTLVWYPAQVAGIRSMTVGDYTKLLETETTSGKPDLTKDAADIIAGLRPTLTFQLRAFQDVPARAGRYPVIIYAPSSAAPSWENADLCEYLASYGYVIVASPGANETTADLARANTQAKDISFLIDFAKTLPNTDTSAVAVIGYSWGGLSNLFAAARDKRIGALVALDGSMRYEPEVIQEAGDIHPAEIKLPLLYFAEGHFTLEEIASVYDDSKKGKHLNPDALNQWTGGDRFIVYMLGLIHEEFSSMFQRNEAVWKMYAEHHKADYSRADGMIGYALVARYTLNFLNNYLKHDPSGSDFLRRTPAQNGAPPHTMQVTFQPAKP